MSSLKIFLKFNVDLLRNKKRSEIHLLWQPIENNILAVSAVSEKRVGICNRQSGALTEITLPAACTHLAWNRDGMFLAMSCWNGQAPSVFMWSPISQQLVHQDLEVTKMGLVTWIGWCPSEDVLGICFASGNVILLDKTNDKKTEVRGPHSHPVTDGAWSTDGILATCSLSDMDPSRKKGENSKIEFISSFGERILPPRECPYGIVHQLRFAVSKFVQGSQLDQNTLCCVANRKTLVLFNLDDETRSLQYSFKADYGELINFSWFGDGYILICFEKGVLIWVSSHPDEHGKELQHLNVFQSKIADLEASVDGSRFAICSDNAIKIFYTNIARARQSEAVISEGADLQKLAWTTDSILLAAAGTDGQIHVFLAKVSNIGCSWRSEIAFMVSLDTFHIAGFPSLPQVFNKVTCTFEPSFVALGPNHFAASINNLIYYYRWSADSETSVGDLLGTYEYSGIVRSVELGWEVAVVLLTDGRITTHELSSDKKLFISRIESTIAALTGLQDILCLSLAHKNLYFGGSPGYLGYASLPEPKHEVFFRHTCGVSFISVKEVDALIGFIDIASEVFLYCFVTDVCLKLPGISGRPLGLLLDWNNEIRAPNSHASHFLVHSENHAQLYAFIPFSINGSFVEEIKSSSGQNWSLEYDSKPLAFCNGEIACVSNGSLYVKKIIVFRKENSETASMEDHIAVVENLIKLHLFTEAAFLCRKFGFAAHLEMIGQKCIQELNIQLAVAVYRQCGRYDKVQILEPYLMLENIAQLAGYMSLIDNQPDLAREWFLKAGDPIAVLYICSDLLEWEKAVTLAEKYAPEKVSYACQQHAFQLQLMGDYSGALSNYERALSNGSGNSDEIQRTSKTGLAKVCLKMGDISRGLMLCRELQDPVLMEDCAEILEDDRRFIEAARLYRECGVLHKAANTYLRAKDWKMADEIIQQIDSVPLKLQLAKAKESANDFKGAVKLYEAAGEYNSVVRLLLDALNRTDLAIEIVEKTRSQEGAKMVATHFMRMKDFPSAIKYLIISNRAEEAFLTAQQYNQMDAFLDVIGDSQAPELCEKIAIHFENKKDFLRAAQFRIRAGTPQLGVTLLLRELKKTPPPPNEDDFLEVLVSATAKCNHTVTTEAVSQFLLGNEDGIPKNEKYLLDLYLLSGQFQEADRITLLVADHYLKSGEYKGAHDILFRTYSKMISTNFNPSGQLLDLLALVHSHAVSTVMHGIKDHEKVARMLIRICSNIARFPKDAARFLLSAVLECSRCQLQKSAMNFALMLMQPEYRSIVTPKYESKILNILRKGDRVVDRPDTLTECPFSDHKLLSSSLFCPLCKVRVPFCILTGMHIIKSDLVLCPGCAMPAIFSEASATIEKGVQSCPMCSCQWSSDNLHLASSEESAEFLKRLDIFRLSSASEK